MKFMNEKLREFISYPFAELDSLKEKLKRAGRTIIDMGVGDPDFPPPKEIQGALVASLANPKTHNYPSYTGERELRQSFARFFLQRYKIKLDPEKNILVLIGTKEGIFHLPNAILNSGDIGAYTEPSYPVYRAGIVLAGGIPKELPLTEDNNFFPDLSTLDDNVKLLFINYPNNPTTQVATKEFYEKLVTKAHEKGFLIANDASYNEIYFSSPPPSILEVDGALDVAVEFHSLSKTFSMSGWRIGFVVGNSDAIFALSALKKNIDSGVFRAVQAAAKTAIDSYWQINDEIRAIYRDRVKAFKDALTKSGLESFNFGATFYIWTKIPDSFGSSFEFVKFLLEETGILAMPGESMGPSGKRFVRFSMTVPNRKIEEAMDRISKIKF